LTWYYGRSATSPIRAAANEGTRSADMTREPPLSFAEILRSSRLLAGLSQEVLARALRHAGYLAWRQGDGGHAAERLSASLALARELDDQQGLCRTLGELEGLVYYQGDDDAAYAYAEEALAAARAADDQWALALALLGMGMILVRTCCYAEGKRHWRAPGPLPPVGR
jgi:hypothetical protein